MESAVWGLIGALVGAFASIATTYIQTRNEKYLREVEERRQRDERLRAFQRDTLIEVQDALHDFWRMATRCYLEDEAAFKKTGKWAAQLLSEEVNEGHRALARRVTILLERIADDQLRSNVKKVLNTLASMSIAREKTAADRVYYSMAEEGPQVMEQIGKVLRSQY
jgi:hypothetical protein